MVTIRDSKGRFVKGSHAGKEFSKGYEPWNKGKETGLVPKTTFKKGHKTWCDGLTKESDERLNNSSIRMKKNNPMYDPTIKEKISYKNHPNYKGGSINQDGYRILNIRGRIVSEHTYIWEKHFGQVPEGYVIHHNNRDKLDNRIENLMCIERGEHMKLHHQENLLNSETKVRNLLSKSLEERRNYSWS